MEMFLCRNCKKLTGHKRAIGAGTLIAVFFTGGLWLPIILFYPKRCIVCGLGKYDPVSTA